MIAILPQGRRPIDPRYAGADDARAQDALGDQVSEWAGYARGYENRIWCNALHRGGWPS